jgi:formamidopyrimidine-DNA glycosylase
MPELPDLTVYIEALERRIVGQRLTGTRLVHPFVLRTYEPPIAALQGRRVERIRRLGKRIAIGFEGDLWLAIHLMIAGRLHWSDSGAARSGPAGLARFDFETGTLTLTEAGSKRRASLAVVAGSAQLAAVTPPGIEVLEVSRADFAARLAHENHTVKRALTDPRLFAGIGNAYSDEILHRARLSPLALTRRLDADAVTRLYEAMRAVLGEWVERLRREAGADFPRKVTAFRPGMAVHGRYGEPCPVCGTRVQRIRYAENETNYCPRCQTQGRVLADRALSRLLKKDWPRTIEELESG